MADFVIGNRGEVSYKDETSEITWDAHEMPTLHEAPQIDELTKCLYSNYRLTGLVLPPTSPARLPPQGARQPACR